MFANAHVLFPVLVCFSKQLSLIHRPLFKPKRNPQIGTAITFLQNPGVKRNPLNQKQQFLRTKGLTEDEIQIACERAGVFTGISGSGGGGTDAAAAAAAGGNTVINMGISTPQTPGKYGWRHQHPLAGFNGSCAEKTMFQHVRDMVSASALVAGVAYAVYMFYKVSRSR